MNRCKICLSSNVTSVAEKGYVIFNCKNCGAKDTRIIQTDRELYSKKINGNIVHTTIAALIEKDGKYLVVERKQFPYGKSIITGHLELNEIIKEALVREIKEETNLTVETSKLLLNRIVLDECKNGASYHEWFLFKCKCNGTLILNSESSQSFWYSKKEINQVNLLPVTKYILNKAGIIDSSNVNQLLNTNFEEKSSNSFNRSIISNLPFPVVVWNKDISFKNKSAEHLFSNIHSKLKLEKVISELAKKCAAQDVDYSRNIEIDGLILNLTAAPFVWKYNRGATVSIIDITNEKEKENQKRLSYESSLAICSNETFPAIYKTLLSQLLDILDINSCNLMILNNDYLKVAFYLSKSKSKNINRKKLREMKIGEGVAGWVAENKTPLAVLDTKKDPNYLWSKKKGNSLLSIPVLSDNKILGVLNLTKKVDEHFSQEEVDSAYIIANRIALAMENDRLYQELNNERKTSEKVLGTTTDGLIMLDTNLNLVFTNKAAERLLCASKKEIVENNIWGKELTKKNRKEFIDIFRETISTKKKMEREFVRNTGNNVKALKIVFNPVFKKDNVCEGVLIGINDITKIKTKELMIKNQIVQIVEERKKVESIIENSGEGIFAENYSGDVLIWNKSIQQITGFEKAADFFKENPNLKRIKEAKIESENLHTNCFYNELMIKNSDNQFQWIGATYSLVRKESKEIDQLIVLVRNISQEKAIETQQKEFIYMATHELRTPITAIKGYLSMILNGDAGKVNQTQKIYFNRAYQSTERLVNLVEDLLQVARNEDNKNVKLTQENFNISDLIKNVMIDFYQKAEEKRINLIFSSPENNIEVKADKEKIKHALSNLIDNAIKYTQKGEVKISVQKTKKNIEIRVADTGVGIPKNQLKNIFNKFHRVQNSESVKAGGAGLGLFIVKNFIEKQNGKIEVESKLGKGSSFLILMPIKK